MQSKIGESTVRRVSVTIALFGLHPSLYLKISINVFLMKS